MNKDTLIANYAHDFRDITMNEDELEDMLANFTKELEPLTNNKMTTLVDFLFQTTSTPDTMDNLFSANHRNNMIGQYGYSEAEYVTVDELNFQYGAWLPESPKELVF